MIIRNDANSLLPSGNAPFLLFVFRWVFLCECSRFRLQELTLQDLCTRSLCEEKILLSPPPLTIYHLACSYYLLLPKKEFTKMCATRWSAYFAVVLLLTFDVTCNASDALRKRRRAQWQYEGEQQLDQY